MQHECTTVTASAINEAKNKKEIVFNFENESGSLSYVATEVNKKQRLYARKISFMNLVRAMTFNALSLVISKKTKSSVNFSPPQAVINFQSMFDSIDFSFFVLFSRRAQFPLLLLIASVAMTSGVTHFLR